MDSPCSRFQVSTLPQSSGQDDFQLVKARVNLLDRLLLSSTAVSSSAGDSPSSGALNVADSRPTAAQVQAPQLLTSEVKHRPSKMSRQSSANRSASKLQHVLQKRVHQSKEEDPQHNPKHGPGLSPAPGSVLGTPALSDLYRMQHDLGKGHMGSVSLVRCRSSKKTFACKTILKSSIKSLHALEEMKKEILVMAEVQLLGGLTSGQHCGPFLVRLYEVCDDTEALYLIMDLCDGDLLHHIVRKGRLPESECATMLLQLLTGLSDLHRMGLVHRDIKPENILLTRKNLLRRSVSSSDLSQLLSQGVRSYNYKLADFGASAQLTPEGQAMGMAGSPKYMAPEVVKGDEYGCGVDVWSLGVVLFSCLAGKQPFVGAQVEDVFKAVQSSTPDFHSQDWAAVSPEAKALVASMLCKDPLKRITIPEIFRHPWLMKHSGVPADVRHLPQARSVKLVSLNC